MLRIVRCVCSRLRSNGHSIHININKKSQRFQCIRSKTSGFFILQTLKGSNLLVLNDHFHDGSVFTGLQFIKIDSALKVGHIQVPLMCAFT